jgi:Zn-finger nucleic acid-binding protein
MSPLSDGNIMPQLAACPQCKLEYDVGNRPIGSRFRCHCGAVVQIRRRLGQAAAACPQSGSAAQPETLTCEKTSLVCPACGQGARLGKRQVRDATVMECPRCAGLWLAADVLASLVQRASHDALDGDWRLQSRRHSKPRNPMARCGSFYRKCPSCGKLMNRFNYARHSGVIVDACRDHGVWFDADGLPQILQWARSGGLAGAQQEDADDAARQQRREAAKRLADQRGPFMQDVHQADDLSISGIDAIGMAIPILDVLFWIARRFFLGF